MRKIILVILFICFTVLANHNEDKFNVVNNIQTSFDPKILFQTSTEQASKSVLTNDNALENKNVAKIKSENIAKNKSHVFIETKTFDDHLSNYLEKTKGFCHKYKYPIIFSTIIGSYGILLFLLARGHLYLCKENTWASWPNNQAFKEVLEIPHQDLAEKLLQDIQKKYQNKKNKSDFITPMATFINEIDTEKNKILFYTKLYKTLKKLHLINLFPVSNIQFEASKEKIQRLAYIKNIFLSWTTNISPKKFAKKKSISGEKSLDKIAVNITNRFSPTITSYLSNSRSNLKTITFHSFYSASHIITEMAHIIKNKWHKTSTFVKENKRYIIPAVIIATYLTTLFNISRGNSYLDNQELWSSWKKSNDDKLIKHLLIEIQKRYIDKNNPVDFITPLAVFIKQIEDEKKSLIFYAKLYNIIQSLYLLKLFPVDKTCFSKVEEKIKHLRFIRNIFLTWAARYKIEQNKAYIF